MTDLISQDVVPLQPEYKTIPLTRGLEAIVDADDYERLSQHKWHAHRATERDRFYAVTTLRIDGKIITERMHRMVMGATFRDGKIVDHISPAETLDNRKRNLRFVTASQSSVNAIRTKQASGVRGVYKRRNRWSAQIMMGHKRIWLGTYNTKEQAAEAYRKAAIDIHGEFARFDQREVTA